MEWICGYESLLHSAGNGLMGGRHAICFLVHRCGPFTATASLFWRRFKKVRFCQLW